MKERKKKVILPTKAQSLLLLTGSLMMMQRELMQTVKVMVMGWSRRVVVVETIVLEHWAKSQVPFER